MLVYEYSEFGVLESTIAVAARLLGHPGPLASAE